MSATDAVAPPLLHYAVTTDPFPLVASPHTGALSQYTLTIQVWNPTPNVVSLEGLQVVMPIGKEGSDLTRTAPATGQVVPPAGWRLEPIVGPGVYTFAPAGGGSVNVGPSYLSFVFEDVAANRVHGDVTIAVHEGTGGCLPPDCPTAPLALTKWPFGFGQVRFWTDTPNISAGQPAMLHWHGPDGATYAIQYAADGSVVNVPGAGEPPLKNNGAYKKTPDATTIFTLTVTDTIDGSQYTSQDQITVWVEQPPPSISKFSGGVSYDAEGVCTLTFEWQAENAANCNLTGIGLVPTSSASGDNTLTVTKPGEAAFTLTALAEGASTGPTSTLTLEWGVQSYINGDGEGNFSASLAASGDGRFLYLVIGDTVLVYDPGPPHAVVRSGSLEDATLWCTSGAVAAGTGGGPSYTVWTTLYSEQRFGAWLQPFSDDPIGGTQPVNVTAGLPISPLFSSSSRVGVKPDGSIVYFADAGGEEIAAFKYGAAGLTPLGSTQVGSFDTGGLAVAHDGSVYFVNGNAIYSYTPTTTPVLNQTGAKQLVSDGTLAGCAVAGNAVFAVSAGSLFVLDRSLNPLRDPISLATGAASIAVSPDGMRAFVYSFWKASTQWQVNVLAPAALTGGTPG